MTGTPGQSVQVSWRADLHGVRACSGDPELSPSGLARLTYSVFNTNPFGGGNERGDRALSACGDNTLSDSGVMYLEVGDRGSLNPPAGFCQATVTRWTRATPRGFSSTP